jgi:alpha-beta hydrolase superfamily lysophospholipase
VSGRLVSGCAVVVAVGLLVAGCGAPGKTARPGPTTTLAGAGGTPNGHGPFAVGVRNETFTDTTRRTPANGSVPEKPRRSLDTIIEYPAQGNPDSQPIKGAAPASGRFPMVVYVHGFSAHAEGPYLHYWAAAGFVAVAPSFPLTNTDTPGGPNLVDAVREPGDVSFVISEMLHLPARDADVQRIIDPDAVAVMGTSLGAGVAQEVAYNSRSRDRRIKAAVEVAGGCAACAGHTLDPNGTYFAGASVPLMLIHGTADPIVPYQGSEQEFAQAPSPKYLLTLMGAKHVQFGPPWEPIAAQATIDFFNRYLKHDDAGLRRLAVDANVPDVASLQQAPE